MRSSLWLANLGFIPRGVNVALLFLRITLGGSLVALHGWSKFIHWQTAVETFPDPLGMGRHFTLGLAIFAEVLCGAMIVAGIMTRLAAAVLTVFMAVILFQVHHGDFTLPGAELAAVYLFGFGTLVLAGGGRFSADEAGGPYALAGFGLLAGGILGYPLSYYFQGGDYKTANTMGGYLSSIGTVLQDPATKMTALLVWTITVLALALGGFLVGRAMHRRIIRTTPEDVVVIEPIDPNLR